MVLRLIEEPAPAIEPMEPIETQFFRPAPRPTNERRIEAIPIVSLGLSDPEDEDTLVDFDRTLGADLVAGNEDAAAFGVPRPWPFGRVVLLLVAACALLCGAGIVELVR
jgi:hypothetical protein